MALNFAGKSGSTSSGLFSGGHIGVDQSPHHGHAGAVTVPDPYLLFSGDYKRSGPDLILSKDGREHVVENYFVGEKRAALAAPDGAQLSGDIVNALTGHVQVAQASGAVDAGKVIGHVTKLTGNATVIRNGVSIVLNMGDNVHKGDVVQSGSNSSLGITFIDGTVFGLASNARMVLNEMVYDPNGSSNSSFLTLVQGTITFVAGQTAKHGDMKIGTPVATMGIRGTACLVEIDFDVPVFDPSNPTVRSIPVKFHVLREKDGTVGSYFLYANNDLTFSNPIATINRAGEVTAFNANGLISVYQVTQIAPEIKAIIDQTLLLYNPNPQSNPTPGSTPADPVAPGTPGSTTPLKDLPVGTPTPLEIPISFPDPDHPGQTIHETANVTFTALKKVDVTPVVDKTSFAIADQVKISDSDPSDVLTPYVPGSGKVLSVAGPATTPAGIDLRNFITVDAATGHVSYDLARFAFLKAGDKVVVTIEFDSSAGVTSFHESLTVTINGANDAPVIDHATIAVPEGGTVVLSAENIGVSDPDNSSATFTVSNVTHGRFQITADGNVWVDATTFTTGDLTAGHVRFVHDGGEAKPTFSIQADDGEALDHLSATVAGTVDFANVNDAPTPTRASIVVLEGGAVVLDPMLISVEDPDSSSFTFTVSNVTHGVFQRTADGVSWSTATTFTSADLAAGHVRFLHNGDEVAPTFSIQADDGAATNHLSNVFAGTTAIFGSVNDAPIVKNVVLDIVQGGTVVLGAADITHDANNGGGGVTVTLVNPGIRVNDPDSNSFSFAVSNVSHGKFQTTTDGSIWIDATVFTTADLSAGHVRFVHDGSRNTPTFSLQADDGATANNLSNVVAGTVHLTIIDSAPAIDHASLTVSQGGTVRLTTANISFTDPDDSVVTYTVSNLSHGHFELISGNVAQPVTSFTSDDVAASRVAFAHDGSSGAPTFSLTPNDGFISGATAAGAVTFSAANYTLTSSEGIVINVTTEGATSGFVFPGAGNVTTPGIPEDRIAIGYDVGASHVVLNNAPLLGVHQMTPVTSETHSSGGTTFVSTTLDAGHGVTLVQTLALGSDANFFTTTIDITNNGTADISNLRFLRNFDPDQDVDAHGVFKTHNDVVQNPNGAQTFAILSATGVESGTKVAMVGLGAEWRASVFGFTNADPYATHAFDAPVDPNGALADLSLSLTSSLGALTAGSHVQVTYITTNNFATEGSNALYGTAGNDFIDGESGDDLLIGLGGADIFAFSRFPGNAAILDFTPGTDKILINFAVIPEAGSLNEAGLDAWKATPGAFESVGGDTLIHLDPTQSILLKNVAIGDLHADDFGGHTIDLAPVAVDDSNAITAGGATILGTVLGNDSDPEFDAISVSNVQSGTPSGSTFVVEGVYGELRLSKNGTYFYTLGANLNQGDPIHLAQANALNALGDGGQATESFTYSVSDGMLSDDAVLRITVTGAYPQFALTVNSDTFTGDPARPTSITGNAATLTSGDSLMGAGHDLLALSGGGNFDLNAVAAYSGIAQVKLANSTGSIASLSLRNGATTDVVTASGSGPSTLNVGGTSVVNNIQGHWGTVNLAGNVTIGGIQGDSGSNTVFFADAVSWNPNITIDGGGGSDTLFFWGFPFAENEVTIDLRAASLTNIENLVFPGVNNTLIVDADALAGFTTLTGFGSRIITYDSTLGLTGKTVGELSVQSANAAGTTFTVSDKATALHVYGGNGQDTLQALSLAFTPQERDIIFAMSSIETIIDSSGTFTASPDSHVFKLTPGTDSPVLTAADETINGSSVTLNAADNLNGGGGTDTLVLYGAGDFNLNTLAGYSGIEQVQVVNFTDSLASVLLRGGTTTDVASAAGGGRSTLNIGDGSIVNSVQGHWSTVSVNGTGAVGSIQGDSADNSFFFGSSASWNPNITIDGGSGSDILVFWGFVFTENDATIDLRTASLTNIESLLFPGVNNTLLVDADALTGFTTIIGSAASKIVTSATALDLSGKAVTGLSVQSSNSAGTTFGVSDKATAFQIYGGAGNDTLQTSNFAFTSQERTAVFANSSIETIIDNSGTYHSINYVPPPETSDVIVTGTEDVTQPFALSSSGSAARGFVFDTVPGASLGAIQYTDAFGHTGTAVAGVEYAAGTTFAFIPAHDWNGTAVFQYHAVGTSGVPDLTPNDLTFQFAAVNDAPVIATDDLTVTQNGFDTTISGLSVSDSDSSSSEFTVTATADSGVASPASDTGDLAEINSDLANNGIVYSPAVPTPLTDKVSVTAADKSGATDTVNLIFNVSGVGPNVTLQGTPGKDVIFATGYQDTLMGSADADQFVFASHTGIDTITDFTPGQDKIRLNYHAFDAAGPNDFSNWLATHAAVSGSDVLIDLNVDGLHPGVDTILLKNVTTASLHAGDFHTV